MSINGKVKWFNGTKGYGFIEREDKEKDVFVHASAVRDAGLRYLNEGDEITFEVEDSICDLTNSAIAPGPFFSLNSSINFPKFSGDIGE